MYRTNIEQEQREKLEKQKQKQKQEKQKREQQKREQQKHIDFFTQNKVYHLHNSYHLGDNVFNCTNPILNESDFDVNCVIFNSSKRENIKNIVARVLIDIKNIIDDKKLFQKWILSLNKNIHNSIVESLKDNDIKSFIVKSENEKSYLKEKTKKTKKKQR
jgi:hypothetical protein